MRHLKLVIQYDGTAYSGWQIQQKETTIQGSLEDAVYSVTGERTRVTGAARTDAGVHAFEQVAALSTLSALSPEILLRALNAHLPDAIRLPDLQARGLFGISSKVLMADWLFTEPSFNKKGRRLSHRKT
jgi:tRNA pseudouridine38-40 synthase